MPELQKRIKPKEIRTSHVLWAYTGRQRPVWRKTELVRIKFRIKSMLVKMDVQYPHGGINKGPWHNKRLSVNTFTHEIKRLTRAANIRLFPSLRMTRATPSAGIIVSIHSVKKVLPRKLANARPVYDIPNGYYACRIDS
jgi:ribosomal protein S14